MLLPGVSLQVLVWESMGALFLVVTITRWEKHLMEGGQGCQMIYNGTRNPPPKKNTKEEPPKTN